MKRKNIGYLLLILLITITSLGYLKINNTNFSYRQKHYEITKDSIRTLDSVNGLNWQVINNIQNRYLKGDILNKTECALIVYAQLKHVESLISTGETHPYILDTENDLINILEVLQNDSSDDEIEDITNVMVATCAKYRNSLDVDYDLYRIHDNIKDLRLYIDAYLKGEFPADLTIAFINFYIGFMDEYSSCDIEPVINILKSINKFKELLDSDNELIHEKTMNLLQEEFIYFNQNMEALFLIVFLNYYE